METIQLTSQQPKNKEEQIITRKRTGKLFLEDIVLKVSQGLIPAPYAALHLKDLEKEFKKALSSIEEQAKDDLRGPGTYVFGDQKLTFREGSVSIDYSECEEVKLMEQHLKELKGKYKAALEGVETGITVVLEEHCFADSHGQILKLPKRKYNKSSIVLTKV